MISKNGGWANFCVFVLVASNGYKKIYVAFYETAFSWSLWLIHALDEKMSLIEKIAQPKVIIIMGVRKKITPMNFTPELNSFIFANLRICFEVNRS